jgi:hypothetical protein
MVFRFPTSLCYRMPCEKATERRRIYHGETHAANGFTHLRLPLSGFSWSFGDENKICSSSNMMGVISNNEIANRSLNLRDASHQSQPTTMPTHHLKDERSLVGSGRGIYAINCLADSMQSRRSTNRQVGHGHVVIDRPDESNYLEVSMLDGLSLCDLSCLGIRRKSIGGHRRIPRPEVCSSFTRPGHSDRNTSAPVRDPSPPQTTRASMPSLTILNAALSRPS